MDDESLTTQESLNLGKGGDSSTGTTACEACSRTTANPNDLPLTDHLMERIVELDNLRW